MLSASSGSSFSGRKTPKKVSSQSLGPLLLHDTMFYVRASAATRRARRETAAGLNDIDTIIPYQRRRPATPQPAPPSRPETAPPRTVAQHLPPRPPPTQYSHHHT